MQKRSTSSVYYTNHMDVSKNNGTPKSSIFSRVFHYKPSILGYPYFWKHPYTEREDQTEQNYSYSYPLLWFSSSVDKNETAVQSTRTKLWSTRAKIILFRLVGRPRALPPKSAYTVPFTKCCGLATNFLKSRMGRGGTIVRT